MNSYTILRVGVPSSVGAELAEALGELREGSPAVREDVADLDVVGVEHARGLEEQLARLVGGATALVVRVEEPVHQELELEVTQPVVVEDALHLLQAPGLEHVLEVGVPDAEAAEADLARLPRSGRAQSKRLHSRPVCTSTGPETVQ